MSFCSLPNKPAFFRNSTGELVQIPLIDVMPNWKIVFLKIMMPEKWRQMQEDWGNIFMDAFQNEVFSRSVKNKLKVKQDLIKDNFHFYWNTTNNVVPSRHFWSPFWISTLSQRKSKWSVGVHWRQHDWKYGVVLADMVNLAKPSQSVPFEKPLKKLVWILISLKTISAGTKRCG